jgi:tRNA 2-selenouridine synthase
LPEIIEIAEFIHLSATIPVVDVRSPAEFEHGRIPVASNIPVFSNEERAEIGTLYKQKGPGQAMQRGLELVEPNLLKMAEKGLQIAKNNELLVHCWRGGLRSSSMAELFETAGIRAKVLRGGYKAYRQFVRESFSRKLDLKIVGGETGSGKTEIIAALRKLGEQVIDLEGLAHHRGSSFGAIGMEEQPTVEQFENILFDAFRSIDPQRRIWLEDESRAIGRVFVPEALWLQMQEAPVYRVQIPFGVRVQRLIHDYAGAPKELLLAALERIKKRLGGLDYKNAAEAFENGDLAAATEIALRYYDKAYDYPHAQRNYANVQMIACADGNPETNAERILNAAGSAE